MQNADVNAEEKTAVVSAAEKKESVKTSATGKAAKTTSEKRTRKTGTRKTTGKRKPVKKTEELILQFAGREMRTEEIQEKVKSEFVSQGHRKGLIRDLKVYIKPDESAAYYVINEKYKGRVGL